MWNKLKYIIGRELVQDYLFEDFDRAKYYMLDLVSWARCRMSQKELDHLIADLASQRSFEAKQTIAERMKAKGHKRKTQPSEVTTVL